MHISTSIGGLHRVSQKSLKHLPLSKGSNHGWHINQHQPTSGASMDIYGWVKTCCLTNSHLHIPTSRTPIIPLRFWRQLSHSPFRRVRNVHHPTIIRPSDHPSVPSVSPDPTAMGHAKPTEVTAISERWRSSHELHLKSTSPWCHGSAIFHGDNTRTPDSTKQNG